MKLTLSKLQEIKRKTGIYALKKDGVIVYIGQSSNVYCRVLEHIVENKKEFDSIRCLYNDDLLDVQITEVSIISILLPKYNKLTIDFDLYYKILPKEINNDTLEEFKEKTFNLIEALKDK